MKSELRFLHDYLGQIQVNVSEWGYLTVYPGWEDLDYTPGYNKFYLICGGEGYLRIGDQEYRPQTGDWYWMPRGIRQAYSSPGNNRLTKYWCHFTATIGDIDLAQLLDIPHVVRPPDLDASARKFANLIEACGSHELSAVFRIKAFLLELIADYLELAGVSQLRVTSPAISIKLQQVVRHIEQHLDADLPVDGLARIVHLHPNYFSRIFRSHMGLSPVQYIRRRRVARAAQLALTGDDTFSDIARQVGIHDLCYFSRIFKDQTGYAPSEYRKVNRNHLNQ